MPSRPAVAWFAALLACSASAQEQTVESAMEFLSEVLDGQRYNPNLTESKGEPVRLHDRWGTIKEVGPDKRCVLAYKAPMPEGRRGSSVWKAYEREGTWDFSKVLEIRKAGAIDLEVVRRGQPLPLAFRLNSESLRDRVAYAMDYLRVNCDALRRTGF